MRVLLDLVYLALGLIASPVILLKIATSERWRAGFRQRFGGVPERAGDKPCVWIHAVSVGEAKAARHFVELIEREQPGWDVRVSTTTNTGQCVARELYGAERCFYFPLDVSLFVKRAFRRVRPDAIVLVELELWPNFLRIARRLGVPVIVINGRMREERVHRYRRGRFLFSPAFDAESGNVYCVQNDTYRDRFVRAGVPPEMARVTGNMKYDTLRMEPDEAKVAEIRDALGIRTDEEFWVAGCTWPGEEDICLRIHRMLQEHAPGLRLVIAPRHIERAGDVGRAVVAAGYRCRRRSAADEAGGPDTVALLDTVGELGYVYGSAAFAFVGKSLTAQGGHDMLEPAAFGATPVFGPLTDNFDAEARMLLGAEAAEVVRNEEELGRALLRLLQEPDLRRQRVERGREVLRQARGASERNLDALRAIIARTPQQ